MEININECLYEEVKWDWDVKKILWIFIWGVYEIEKYCNENIYEE